MMSVDASRAHAVGGVSFGDGVRFVFPESGREGFFQKKRCH